MKRAILATCAACLAFGQSTDTPTKFEIADVHVSPKSPNQFFRATPVRGSRYEMKNATMVDLIASAYEYAPDKVLEGPNWLEMDRFDVIAKVPAGSNPETLKPMLRSLLEERFALKVHKDTKPLPTFALTVGKKPQLKEAEGTEDTGCKPQSPTGVPAEGGGISRMTMMNQNGTTTSFTLGPGMTIQYACRNMTMAAFAAGLRGMMGAFSLVGSNPVLDQTGLKGAWNFDFKYSMTLNGPMMQQGDRIPLNEAVEKQLGLKLEEKQIPTPVIVVDSVKQKPTDNPPGVAEALPVIPPPTEFEVATIKPTDPEQRMGGMIGFRTQPGGRLTSSGMPMRFLLSRAFNVNNNDAIVGLPAWVDSERFDINAKAPSMDPNSPPLDNDAMAPMIRALMVDRFKMKYHTEERPVSAYSLVAGKPKMKKADPNSRTFCKNSNAPAGAPPGSRVFTCQNITVAQFAERLQNMVRELSFPVLDATGIEGGWDFALTFSQNAMMMMGGAMPVRAGGGEGGPAGAAMPTGPDPTGGYTIFTAIEKQLGLKLEAQKRTLPVIVIDHLEQRPTDN
jgi:uncharacterized protein (TIGR03435 family)